MAASVPSDRARSHFIILVAIILLLAASLVAIAVYQGAKKSPFILTVSLSGPPVASKDVSFAVSARPPGPGLVFLSYELRDAQSQQIAWTKTESVSLDSSSIESLGRIIPAGELQAGDYLLSVTAESQESRQKKTAFLRIIVGENGNAKDTGLAPAQEKGNASPASGQDALPRANGANKSAAAPLMENGAQSNEAASSSGSGIAGNAELAGGSCPSGDERDGCLLSRAEQRNDSSLCMDIGRVSLRDSCLAGLAVTGAKEICNDIEDAYLKEACERVKGIDNA
ncbi:TPA: hypothetical protein HA281_02170 [Candidatus Woesearchaeota archaeon]|nr:MAG: hypothetical protein QT04_C0024G0003 [archaeon GW2011_AR11]HIH04796.1 hypothetical protein [Candidatus Woesearchaeota archaeon]HIH91586.1 hypothetical protein [Candidatus Woesearchaeota archaeon]HII64599.1 hypothetical protein [Candidatus Woesearchaeota archaeon]HIJ18081.1 hypothetical protein [Candidatus Woesearchaeota archaeon]